jgi:hypothetical protein
MTMTMKSETDPNAPKYLKKNQQLPVEVVSFFKSTSLPERDDLIRKLSAKSWTFEAISNASSITRERVRQITKDSRPEAPLSAYPFDIPYPPLKPEREKREYVEPRPETLKRLLELQPYAQLVRSNGTKYREEAEEYTRLLDHSHNVDGVTLYRLAKRLGVTHGALRFRLVRYGYKQPITATSKVYTPIKQDNRLQK